MLINHVSVSFIFVEFCDPYLRYIALTRVFNTGIRLTNYTWFILNNANYHYSFFFLIFSIFDVQAITVL